jgi:hypothetical protein
LCRGYRGARIRNHREKIERRKYFSDSSSPCVNICEKCAAQSKNNQPARVPWHLG